MDAAVAHDDLVLLAADLLVRRPRLRRVEGEGALRPLDVGHAHAREQRAVLELLRRERDRHAQDRRPHAVRAEELPERLALLEEAQDGPMSERDFGEAEVQRARHRADVARGEDRRVAAGIAGEEVVDVVPRRVDAGREGRPGDRRDRRTGGRERVEAALRLELLEVRGQALAHVLAREARLETLEADDHDALRLRVPPLREGDEAVDRLERPDQDDDEREKERPDEDESRPRRRESCTRPDVEEDRRRGESGERAARGEWAPEAGRGAAWA